MSNFLFRLWRLRLCTSEYIYIKIFPSPTLVMSCPIFYFPFFNFLTVTSAPFITGGEVLSLPVNLGREKLCDNLLGLKSSSLFKGPLVYNVSPWRIQKISYCSQ